LAAGQVFAAPVVWTVPPTTMSDNSVLSGTFTYDATLPGVTAYNLQSTGPTTATYTYVGGAAMGNSYIGQATSTAAIGVTPAVVLVLTGIPASPSAYTINEILVGTCNSVVTGNKCGGVGLGFSTAFNVVLSNAGTVAQSSVPTLNEYAMLVLAAIMALGAAWFMKGRGDAAEA